MILAHDPPKYNSNPIRIAIGPESVEVVDLRLVDQYHLRAVATVRAAGFLINGVRVVRHGGRLSVRMPERRNADGVWDAQIVIEAPALRLAIADAVLDAYKQASIFGGLA